MNNASLKRFAQSARRKLMDQVRAKMQYVLTSDSAELREKAKQIIELKKELSFTTRDQLVERVAYTWFNRLAALRFMDANDYQPIGILVVSPAEGTILPQALNEAKQGNIPAEWKVDNQKINDLLDRRIPSSNPQNEVYRELLIAACNHLHSLFPFLFESIDDYTELLLPDDLTSDFSIVNDIVNGMSVEDCRQVEILGWLYQFYISEEKDRLINAKKKYMAHEIAPVTQLFTPHWIVRYMVDNTLGQLWKEMHTNSRLTDHLEFYIKPENENLLPKRKAKSPEEISFFDPCCGSGHILTYAFDLYYKIYEEEGYNPSEIPALIISKNLYGADIDERAAQLAGFALMMKGRQYHRRFLKKPVIPNIVAYRNVENDPLFENAKVLGSLIQVDKEYVENIRVDSSSLFGESKKLLKKQAELLARQYDVVVTNPPYMNSSSMESKLKKYIEEKYNDTKYDLFASFVIRCLELVKEGGLTGNMTPFVWMFISSYEKLRRRIIIKYFLNNLIQLEYSGFDGATVPICTFTLRKEFIPELKGSYIRLSDFRGSQNQAPKTLEAIQDKDCGWFYTASQIDFQKISLSPIAYDASQGLLNAFENGVLLGKISFPRKGMVTANNPRFIRLWFEGKYNNIGYCYKSREDALNSLKKWFPYTKGGAFRRWCGNTEHVVNWKSDGKELLNLKNEGYPVGSTNHNLDFIFKPAIVWTKITSDKQSFRAIPSGFLFDDASGLCVVKNNVDNNYLLGILNSKMVMLAFKYINPTLNLQPGNVAAIPILFTENLTKKLIDSMVLEAQEISIKDWNSIEISWDFEENELVREARGPNKDEGKNTLKEAFNDYKKHWTQQFFQLHQNEEELNRQFIEIYGLQDELTPDVPLEEITILQQELDRKALAKLNKRLRREPVTLKVLNYPEIKLPFIAKEVMAQFVSYAVGCMFGRYSLEKPGLILANQGETLEDYFAVISNSTAGGEKFVTGNELSQVAETRKPEDYNAFIIRKEQSVNLPQKDEVNPRITFEMEEGSKVFPTVRNRKDAFMPDEDNVIPVLDDEWFEDDIVARFKFFLKVSFGEENFDHNLKFIEKCLGKDIRQYFARDFYADHVRRYKKRPIYWLFSSPGGAFNSLIYMHRYTTDTISLMLNNYLRAYQEKLRTRYQHLGRVQVSGTATEKAQALKEIERITKMLMELHDYEHDILYPLATQRIEIDLDDGVLVNYNKFGRAVKTVTGLNDTKTKNKVRGFDWINTSEIRD